MPCPEPSTISSHEKVVFMSLDGVNKNSGDVLFVHVLFAGDKGSKALIEALTKYAVTAALTNRAPKTDSGNRPALRCRLLAQV